MKFLKWIRTLFCDHQWDMEKVEFLPFTNIEGKQVVKYSCRHCGTKRFINL